MFKLGYNTNGFICHDLGAAIDIIAGLGYQSVAISLDHYALNPWSPNLDSELKYIKKKLQKYNLSCVIETGARFLLNPWRKHDPVLISLEKAGRKKRIDFLIRAIDIAAELEAEAVSFWSGKKPAMLDNETAWELLVAGCREVCDHAAKVKMPLGFEPEPGMFIENLSQYQILKQKINSKFFKLTLDLGHAFLTEKNLLDSIFEHQKTEDICNIHLEDMKKGVHQHLFFGEGDMNFAQILSSLKKSRYNGPVNIELSRHSHNAVETARRAFQFMAKLSVPGH